MDPITAAALLSIGATGFGLFQGTQSKEEAEELAKKQQKQDALMNLIRAAGGSPPVPTQQVSVPQVDYAGAMQNLANTGLMYAGGKQAQTANASDAALNQAKIENLNREAAAMGSQPDVQTMANVVPRQSGYTGPLQSGYTDPLKSSQAAENIARTKLIEAQTAEKVAGTKALPSTPNQATLRNAAPTSVGTQDLADGGASLAGKTVATVSQDEMTIYRALQRKADDPMQTLAPEEDAFIKKIQTKIMGTGATASGAESDPLGLLGDGSY